MNRPIRARALAVVLSGSIALCGAPALAQAPDSPWSVTRLGLVYQTAGMRSVRVTEGIEYARTGGAPRTLDLYAPADGGEPRGAVIFVNVNADETNPPRRWAIYRDWCRAVAAEGMIGIVYGSAPNQFDESLAALFEWIAANGNAHGIDPSRLGLYASSANVSLGLPFAMDRKPAGLRCAVYYYGGVDVDTLRDDLPVFYVKAQKDNPNLNRAIDGLWDRARRDNLPWTMVVGRELPHAFDGVDASRPSVVIIRQTLDFWRAHLQELPPLLPLSTAREVNRFLYGQEHAEAARLLEQEAARDTSDVEVERLLLLSYRNLNDTAKGIPLAEKLIRRAPNEPNFRTSYGMLLATAGRQADALTQLETAARLGAQDFNTYFQLMLVAMGANKPDLAVQYGTRAVAIFPTQGVAHYNLACAYVRSGNNEAAIASLEAAVRNGFRDRNTFDTDPDMAPLRQDPRYQALVASLGN
ncbi:MAG TPA: tetratricopeptide repeat protein [Candidatus Eisenbacteria bacterium]